MADIKAKFGAGNQPITCSLAPGGIGLAVNGQRQSTSIDNTINVFLDALVFVNVKTGGAGTVAGNFINIYAYGTADAGTNFSDGASGVDGTITLTAPPNARLIGIINVTNNAITYKGGPFSVAAAFGGVLPATWGIIIENKTGGVLDTTEANHLKVYQGVLAQTV